MDCEREALGCARDACAAPHSAGRRVQVGELRRRAAARCRRRDHRSGLRGPRRAGRARRDPHLQAAHAGEEEARLAGGWRRGRRRGESHAVRPVAQREPPDRLWTGPGRSSRCQWGAHERRPH